MKNEIFTHFSEIEPDKRAIKEKIARKQKKTVSNPTKKHGFWYNVKRFSMPTVAVALTALMVAMIPYFGGNRPNSLGTEDVNLQVADTTYSSDIAETATDVVGETTDPLNPLETDVAQDTEIKTEITTIPQEIPTNLNEYEQSVYTRLLEHYQNSKIELLYNKITGEESTSGGMATACTIENYSKVFAVDTGEVFEIGNNEFHGDYVTIQHADGFQTIYTFLTEIFVSVGDSVQPGDVVGKIGTMAQNETANLIFEVEYENPNYVNNKNRLKYDETTKTWKDKTPATWEEITNPPVPEEFAGLDAVPFEYANEQQADYKGHKSVVEKANACIKGRIQSIENVMYESEEGTFPGTQIKVSLEETLWVDNDVAKSVTIDDENLVTINVYGGYVMESDYKGIFDEVYEISPEYYAAKDNGTDDLLLFKQEFPNVFYTDTPCIFYLTNLFDAENETTGRSDDTYFLWYGGQSQLIPFDGIEQDMRYYPAATDPESGHKELLSIPEIQSEKN